jgi:hypothetical protein
MDSQDRDEIKMRRRDETLARRLGEALDKMDSRSASDCPDGEILAAYAEHGLDLAETDKWESHFASCPRCRKILLVLAASTNTPLAEKEVARLGELVSAVRAPVEITKGSAPRGRSWLLDWRSRWLAPALGVAAVLAVWLGMRPPWRATNRAASETLVARAPKGEAPLTPATTGENRLSRIEPQQDQKTEAAPPADRSVANAQSLNSPVEGMAKGRADAGTSSDSVSPGVDEARSSLQAEKKLNSLSKGREIQTPAIPPSPAPPSAQAAMEAPAATQSEAKAALGTPASAPLPQARAYSNATSPAAPEVPQSSRQTVTVTEAAPQVETSNGTVAGTSRQERSADLSLNGRNSKALATLRPTQGYSALLKASSGSALWRAGRGGIIERSTDAGKTWVSQASPSKEDWSAGVAVSDTVCWLVGRNGAIARTLDGEHWEGVMPPAQAAATAGKLADWTGIAARGPQAATITASDGRKFATADGGKTWQLQ